MKSSRNAPCHCGSGKKWKSCHNLLDHESGRKSAIALRERVAAAAAERRQAYEGRMESYHNKLALASVLGMVTAVAPNK